MRKGVFQETIRKSAPALILYLFTFGTVAAVFYLYALPAEPLHYALALSFTMAVILFIVSLYINNRRARERDTELRAALIGQPLKKGADLTDRDYRASIAALQKETVRLGDELYERRREDSDYYTAWVHEIKTPIAVMRLKLGADERAEARELETELTRIERYVEMVLEYLRLDGGSDLVIEEYALDELIRPAIHKNASMFVTKRLSLSYEGTDERIITDRKQFELILNQLLSNAVKYTTSGGVSIRVENGLLSITDSGLGIAKEDLPRIFEKGFTGVNGHVDRRASGLGLYLTKRAAELIRIPIKAESKPGEGSTFTLDISNAVRK